MRLTSLSFITTAALLLEACDSVPIKDEIFYANKGMLGAIEVHSLTTGTKRVTFEEWMKALRQNPFICTSVDTFGDIKAAMEKLCSVCNCCAYDTTAKAEEFFKTIEEAGKKR